MSNVSDKVILESIQDPNFSFIETFSDAADVEKVTREMTVLLFKHRKARNALRDLEAERVKAEFKLKQKQRQEYINHESAPNQQHRKILVDIACEQEEAQLAKIDYHIKNVNRTLASIKLEIDTWKAISYSLRTEMGSF